MTTTVAGASQAVENLPANAGDVRHRFGPWEDPLEEGYDNPVQYSCLENPMDRGTWKAVYTVAKS